MVKEFINKTVELINEGERIKALLNSTTADAGATSNINVGGTYGDVFSVAGTGGGTFYNLLNQVTIGIIPILETIDKAKLADLDMG